MVGEIRTWARRFGAFAAVMSAALKLGESQASIGVQLVAAGLVAAYAATELVRGGPRYVKRPKRE